MILIKWTKGQRESQLFEHFSIYESHSKNAQQIIYINFFDYAIDNLNYLPPFRDSN